MSNQTAIGILISAWSIIVLIAYISERLLNLWIEHCERMPMISLHAEIDADRSRIYANPIHTDSLEQHEAQTDFGRTGRKDI